MFGRIIFGLIGIPLGIAMVIYAHFIVNNVIGTTFDFAERWFGATGTYTFIRLCGLVIAFVSLMIMVGGGGWIYDSLVDPLSGIGGGL